MAKQTKLEKADLVALSKTDPETMTLAVNDRTVIVDPGSVKRLRGAKLIDSKGGKLTKVGKDKYALLMEKLDKLKAGCPINERTKTDPKAIFASSLIPEWCHGQVSKKDWVTNSEVLFIGRKPDAAMKSKKGTGDQRKNVATDLRSELKGTDDECIELIPYAYQQTEFDGFPVIWLGNEENQYSVPVSGIYYDYIMDRWPKATFHCRLEDEHPPIQIRVKNQGIKWGCVGLWMPLVLEDHMEIPEIPETED